MANYTYTTINGRRFRSTTKVTEISDVEGLTELIRDLADFADEAMPELYKTSDRAAQVVLRRAQHHAPVGDKIEYGIEDDILHIPGTLKRSLKVVKPRTKKGVYIAVSQVTFGKEAAYAIPVELGHYTHNTKVEARPFLRPAADESKQEVVDMMINSMNEILDDLMKG